MKLIKKSLLLVVLIASFGFWGTTTAIAGDGVPTHAENAENLKQTITHVEAALKSAEAGNKEETVNHIKDAKNFLGEVHSETWGRGLQTGSSKLRIAGIKAGRGEMDKAIELLNQSLDNLKKLH